MSNFATAWPVILAHEVGPYRATGGLVDHKDDPGGITKWGVSLRWLVSIGDLNGDGWLDGDINRDGKVDADDIRQMTDEQAMALYHTHWWEKYRYGTINNQVIATKVIDLAINMGPKQCHVIVQRALRATGKILATDGILGPKTFSAINTAPVGELRAAIREGAAGFYRGLILRNDALLAAGVTHFPSGARVTDFSNFRVGWMNRAYY